MGREPGRCGWWLATQSCGGSRPPFVWAQISREEQDTQGESMMQRLQLQYDKEIAFIEEQQRSDAYRYSASF